MRFASRRVPRTALCLGAAAESSLATACRRASAAHRAESRVRHAPRGVETATWLLDQKAAQQRAQHEAQGK